VKPKNFEPNKTCRLSQRIVWQKTGNILNTTKIVKFNWEVEKLNQNFSSADPFKGKVGPKKSNIKNPFGVHSAQEKIFATQKSAEVVFFE
jgi:hypothetical protein